RCVDPHLGGARHSSGSRHPLRRRRGGGGLAQGAARRPALRRAAAAGAHHLGRAGWSSRGAALPRCGAGRTPHAAQSPPRGPQAIRRERGGLPVKRIPAPHPTHRLIPSKFPPIGLFETVAAAGDLEAVMELAGWTNDRLVAERLARLPQDEWAYGRANASIVMAAFLHAAPGGGRFSSPELGAWYASAELPAAAAEVGHHLRREAVARDVPEFTRTFRAYTSR